MKTSRKLWIGLGAMIVLSPLGLLLPAWFGAGSAWGEWSAEEVHRLVGYAPRGMSRLANFWKAPMPDYASKGGENAAPHSLTGTHILSGLIGAAVVVGLAMLLGKVLARRGD